MNRLFIKHPFPTIKQITEQTRRVYEVPSGEKYPSVSTVLSVETAEYLTEWRNKVGEKTANEISHKAASRGTKIHLACENYLQNIETEWDMFEGETKQMFDNLKPILDKMHTIHAIELQMFSHKLKCAGTCDLIIETDDGIELCDWKTSSRYKTREDIPNYFKQLAAYAYMFYEHTKI